jgi:tRNA (guanine37-N1)-methyltransferase
MPGSPDLGSAEPREALRIDVFSLFPRLVDDFCSESLLGKARGQGLLDLRCHDIREQTSDVHRTVDDAPFGGGAGMVMRAQPIFEAVEAVDPPRPLLLLGPGGRRFDQAMASELAALNGFSLLCGRYEGVDHRVRQHLVDGELSVGDVVLSGGEVAACLVIEAVTRLREGAMGNAVSTVTESFGESGCSRSPSSPARRSSAAGRCPRSCAAAITLVSSGGAGPSGCTARSETVPT